MVTEDWEAGYEAGYAAAKAELSQAAGCQLWGIMAMLLTDKEISFQGLDAVQRRIFAFPSIMKKYDITPQVIKDIRAWRGQMIPGFKISWRDTKLRGEFQENLKSLMQQFESVDLARMFS